MRTWIRVAALLGVGLLGTVGARGQNCDPNLRSGLGNAAGDAAIVEALGRIKLGPFEVSGIPAGSIDVQGLQLVGRDLFFTFRMTIDARNSKTKPSFTMAGPEVGGAMIQGMVRRLDVKGCLTIPGKTDEPRIEVPAPKLFFADVLTPQAALPTTLAGIVTLRGHYVELRNRTALRLAMGGSASSGMLDLTASNASTDAVEILAEGSKRSLLLKASFQLPGSSSWLFDLQNPKIRWQSGKLTASPVSLTADEPYVMPLPQLDLEFRQLTIDKIELSKSGASDAVSISLRSLSLDAGSAKLLGTPSVQGRFRAPLKTSGRLLATFTDDAQIVVKDYELSGASIDLELAAFDDGGNLRLRDALIMIAAKRLTATELEGTVAVKGGHLAFAGQIGGSAEISSLDFHVAGKREALDGTGRIELATMSLSGNVSTAPIDRCPGSKLNVDLSGAEASHITGDVKLVKGKTEGTLEVSRFKAAAGLSYYRCEWDQKVGHLGRVEMNGIPYPCPTWEQPLKICQDRWVLWDGGDVFVRWVFVANPTISDVGIEIADLEYNLGKSEVCGGTIHGLTLGLYAVSLTPNLPASGSVLDVFRDTIQTLMGTWQTALVDTLGPAIGALKVVQLECK